MKVWTSEKEGKDEHQSSQIRKRYDRAWSIQAQVSMSRKGNPCDNAYAESLFGTLKREEVDRVRYENLEISSDEEMRPCFCEQIRPTKRAISSETFVCCPAYQS